MTDAFPSQSAGEPGRVRAVNVGTYALPCLVVWTAYLLAFWPGILNADSCVQWEEVVTRDFHDWHPPFQTLTNWVLSRFWFSPGCIALSQIVLLSFAIAWGLAKLRTHGLPAWAAGTLCLIFALSPANAAMSITLVKDVPFSACLLVLSVVILDIVLTRGNSLRGRAAFVPLGCVIALVGLYRHDGVVPAFVGVGLLLLLAKHAIAPVRSENTDSRCGGDTVEANAPRVSQNPGAAARDQECSRRNTLESTGLEQDSLRYGSGCGTIPALMAVLRRFLSAGTHPAGSEAAVVAQVENSGGPHPPLTPPIKGGETQDLSRGGGGKGEGGHGCVHDPADSREPGHGYSQHAASLASRSTPSIRECRLKILAALVLGAAIWVIVTGPVYRAAGVKLLEPVPILFPVMHQIAAHQATGTPLTPAEREFLQRAMPMNTKTGTPYDCASNLELSPEGNWPFIWEHKRRFVEVFWALAVRNPAVSIRHQACLSSYIWQPFRPMDLFFETCVSYLTLDDQGRVVSVYPYSPAYASMNDSKLPYLQLPLARFMGMDPVDDTILHRSMPYLQWVGAPLRPKRMLIWQPALYFYLLIFSVMLACVRRRECRVAAAAAPVLIYVIVIAIMGHNLSFRYMYALSLVSLMFIGLPLLRTPSMRDEDSGQALEAG
ncbi:MAG: hypothetical protein AB1646_00040 [Thermodesulfobacteriota bacterium]